MQATQAIKRRAGIASVASVLAFAASFSGQAAVILYDNLAQTPDGADNPAGFGPLYDSFTSGAASAAISGLRLSLSGTGAPGTLTVGLYGDSSTTPGALIATLGTIDDSLLTASAATYTVSLVSNPVLSPNTRYWIGLVDTGDANWQWGLDNSGPGVSGEHFSNVNGIFPNVDGPYMMSLSVPEPSAYGLIIGLGALGFAGYRRLTKRV